MGAGKISGHAERDVDLSDRIQPIVDDPVQQLSRMRPALERLAVDFEEEPLIGPERGVGDVLPPGAHRLGDRLTCIRQDLTEQLALPGFDGPDDLDPESLLRTEVMDEHPVARTECGREPAQAHIGETVLRHVVDRALQQPLPRGLDTHARKCTIWYMKPVRVTIDTPQSPERVYDFLDVMANHEAFTNHMLRDWECSGPERGIGAKAKVTAVAGGRSDTAEIEVIAAERPTEIVEQNVSARGQRVATGTYRLEPLPSGGTRITFEYAWQRAPLSDRVAAPLVRAILARGNQRAMTRLVEQLASREAVAARP